MGPGSYHQAGRDVSPASGVKRNGFARRAGPVNTEFLFLHTSCPAPQKERKEKDATVVAHLGVSRDRSNDGLMTDVPARSHEGR